MKQKNLLFFFTKYKNDLFDLQLNFMASATDGFWIRSLNVVFMFSFWLCGLPPCFWVSPTYQSWLEMLDLWETVF